jgi:hypothetical protein
MPNCDCNYEEIVPLVLCAMCLDCQCQSPISLSTYYVLKHSIFAAASLMVALCRHRASNATRCHPVPNNWIGAATTKMEIRK